MMRSLFCSKRGILGTVLFSTAVMLIFAFLSAIIHVLRDAVWAHTDMFWLEIVSLIAFVPALWSLCDNAFRFGTANGASRRSVIGSLTVAMPLTAVLVTLANEIICAGIGGIDEVFIDNRLFDGAFTEWFRPDWAWEGSGMVLFDAAVYLLFAMVVVASVAFVYAAYRKFGVFGALCAVLMIMTVYAVFSLILYADTGLSKAKELSTLFLREKSEYLGYENGEARYDHFTVPRLGAFFALIGGYAAVCITAMWLLIRRSSIRPAELGI